MLAVLLQDQRYRWQTNQPFKVEEYLANFPALADHKVNLVVGEFQARKLDATSADIAEFESRFSHISQSLRIKLSALPLAGEMTVQAVATTECEPGQSHEPLRIPLRR